MSRALRSLPRNVTDTVRVLARLGREMLNVEATRALTAESLEDALPRWLSDGPLRALP